MSKGYTDTATLATYMDMEFSASQELIADVAIGTAEAWIDHNSRHAWLEEGPIVEETFLTTRTNLVHVTKPPVKSFDAVTVTWWPGGETTPLPAETFGYYVRSLRDGTLWVPWVNQAYSMSTTYTPNDDDVPDEVGLATLVLAASILRMAPSFNDGVDPTVVQRYVVGGELTVEFRKNLLLSNSAMMQALSYMSNWVKDYVIV